MIDIDFRLTHHQNVDSILVKYSRTRRKRTDRQYLKSSFQYFDWEKSLDVKLLISGLLAEIRTHITTNVRSFKNDRLHHFIWHSGMCLVFNCVHPPPTLYVRERARERIRDVNKLLRVSTK